MTGEDAGRGGLRVLPWVMWGIAALYFFFDYLQQMAPGVMGPELIRAFDANDAVLGTLSAFYFYSYAVMQIPVGAVTDHFGPHRPMTIAACVAAGATALFALSRSMPMAELSRMFVGAGAAFSYVGCLKLVSNWFPATRFATFAGLTSLIGMVGAISGGAPLAYAVGQLGWRGTSWVFVGIGGALAVLILLVVRDHPPGAPRWDDRPEHSRGISKTVQDVKHIVTRGQFWITGLFVTTMNITFTAFGATWGTSFVQAAYHIDKVTSATVVSMLFVGGLVGGPFWGWLSDRIGRRKLPMLVSSGGALAVMVAILYVPGMPALPLEAVYVLLALEGFLVNGLVLGYALGHDLRPPGSAGVSVGFVNTCCAGGTAMFLPIIGWLSALRSPERAAQGMAALTAGDFRFALSLLIGCLAVAFIAAAVSRETHCRLLYDTEDPAQQ